MDLGAVGFGGWGVGSNPDGKRRLYGHGPLIDSGRAPCGGSEDDFRSFKVAKADDSLSAPDKADGVSNGAPLRSNGSSPVLVSGGDPQQQHMLCFSSPKSDVPSPHLNHSCSSLYGKNSGAFTGNFFRIWVCLKSFSLGVRPQCLKALCLVKENQRGHEAVVEGLANLLISGNCLFGFYNSAGSTGTLSSDSDTRIILQNVLRFLF